MSLPRPSGLKAPVGSKLAKPGTGQPQKSGLMQPGSLSRTQSALAKSARAAGLSSSQAEKYAADAAHQIAGEEELYVPPSPADDFIIGDRVYVSGSKPGFIAFLGETQFAPGEWAGVVLDELIGKNDGSVNGVRYFQCETKRGVFCRISKLSRTPGIAGMSSRADDSMSEVSIPMNGDNGTQAKPPMQQRRPSTPSHESRLARPTTPSHDRQIPRPTTPGLQRPTTPGMSRSMNKSLSSSNTSLNKGSAPIKTRSDSVMSTPVAPASGVKHNLSLGDRVLVSGSKLGTLRYIGPTDFAKGEWAGVELDDALGKNDGAVAGKRYFDCRPKYGLFAPVHKVTKAGAGGVTSPMTRSMGSTGLRLSREKSGSQESVSSVSSATSSASRPRVRLGVSGLGNSQEDGTPRKPKATGRPGQRPSTLNISATTSALQKALKEKEEHIEQLLRERDMERSEVARAAAHVEEYEDQMLHLRSENERYHKESEDTIHSLRAHLKKALEAKEELEHKLDFEKRQVEDLQFQIEEEVISKDDLETRTVEEEAKIKELDKNLKKEKEKTEKYETELASLKSSLEHQQRKLENLDETQTQYLDQIEELTHKLVQAENQIQSQDSSRLEEGAKTSQVSLELAEKSAKVSELEDVLSGRDKEVRQLQERVSEMGDELKSKIGKFDKLQIAYEELSEKLRNNEVITNDLSKQVQQSKSHGSELQRQLEESHERNKTLSEEKMQLEQQIGEMMKNSGDSSNQLSMLNDQLGQKTRKVEDLQADLSTSTQKWHSLNDELERVVQEKKRELELLTSQHQETLGSVNSQLEDVQNENEKLKLKLLSTERDSEEEKQSLLSRKENEISELKQQLEVAGENVSQQEIQTAAHKQVLDKITMEKEAVQFEKDKLEKQMRRMETERDGLNNELIQLKVSVARTESEQGQVTQEISTLKEQMDDIRAEKLDLESQHEQLRQSKEEVQGEKDKVTVERDNLQREAMEHKAALQQRDMQVSELQKEVERHRTESAQQLETISQLSEKTTDSGAMQKQLAEHKSLAESLGKQLAELEASTADSKQQLEESVRSLKIEVEDSQETVGLLEENVKEVEVERDSLRSQLETALEARHEQAKLMELNQTLNEEIETIKKRHRQEVTTLKSSQEELQQGLDYSSQMVSQHEQTLQSQLTKISNLENDNSMLSVYKKEKEGLQGEVSQLQDKVNDLQSQLTGSHNNANVISNMETNNTGTSQLIESLKEESQSAQSQKRNLYSKVKRREIRNFVEFLNSVIVDLQHKNEELKVRLNAMESGQHNGTTDAMEISTPVRRVAPRVFCDICDVFDQHETEDCPLQEMSDSPPPTQYHGDRKQVRPYCDICEEFHAPCPGRPHTAPAAAPEVDPTRLVQDWVKDVDSAHSELAAEAEKIFGNDQEFYHVQRDPSEVPGFRDSGYYDGLLDGKLGPNLAKDSLNGTSLDKNIISTDTKESAFNLSQSVEKPKIMPVPSVVNTSGSANTVLVPEQTVKPARPDKLLAPGADDVTSSSASPVSESEYQSGRESLGSDVDSPVDPLPLDKPPLSGDSNSGAQQSGTEQAEGDQNGENCIVS